MVLVYMQLIYNYVNTYLLIFDFAMNIIVYYIYFFLILLINWWIIIIINIMKWLILRIFLKATIYILWHNNYYLI